LNFARESISKVISIERITVDPRRPPASANIVQQYEIQKASWIWHPDFVATGAPHVLIFNCKFELKEDRTFRIHVSADQRYELKLDGETISRGPDRSDLHHWGFASYAINLPAGPHEFLAYAWWLAELMPVAQVSAGAGGFIFAVEGDLGGSLNTGAANWTVAPHDGWSFDDWNPWTYHVIGPSMTLDRRKTVSSPRYVEPTEVCPPIASDPTGAIAEGRRLFPSPLPDQLSTVRRPGRIRAVIAAAPIIQPDDLTRSEIDEWQQLLSGDGSISLAPGATAHILWDLEEYFCGYPEIVLSKGDGATVEVRWAESLFEPAEGDVPPVNKGGRDDIVAKQFYGFGDTFIHDGSASARYSPLWWRSGRYVMLDVVCAREPLVIESVSIIETRYPIENEGAFETEDAALNSIGQIAVRGIQMCSHETFMDCPYYEQIMYVGDTRLEMLTTHVMSPDTRLVKRGIELFDWSRSSTGFVNERYPSTPEQLSLTYSLIWVAMVRDFAWWRDDSSWVRDRLVGVRCLLENTRHLLNQDGLLEGPPGWSFVDWATEWENGMPPQAENGVCPLVNLHFVMALRYAAELERAFGDELLARRNEDLADNLSSAVVSRFWNEDRCLLADDREHRAFSEHAQCLALLTNALERAKEERCVEHLLADVDLVRTTVYFSFYLFEVLQKFGKADLILDRLEIWRNLIRRGFKTPIESPEPSRSDCHAWGSHPLFHFHASVAGIRPSSPGFRSVRVAPHPGKLQRVRCRTPHPRGFVEVVLVFDLQKGVSGNVILPEGIEGTFVWNSKERHLNSGANSIRA